MENVEVKIEHKTRENILHKATLGRNVRQSTQKNARTTTRNRMITRAIVTTCADACLILKRHAGHSKWANIRHIKGAKDHERALLFAKASREIRVAAQEGGSPEPSKNSQLNQALEKARKLNMPVASIENVLKSLKNRGNGKWCSLELKGPRGCMVLCDVFTDNMMRVKIHLAAAMKRTRFTLADSGVRQFFTAQATVLAFPPSTTNVVDTATEHAILVNAADVEVLEEAGTRCQVCFLCEPQQLPEVETKLTTYGYEIIDSTVDYVAATYTSLDDDDLKAYEKLCNRIREYADDLKVYDNIQRDLDD